MKESENINVVVRMRPHLNHECKDKVSLIEYYDCKQSLIQIKKDFEKKSF